MTKQNSTEVTKTPGVDIGLGEIATVDRNTDVGLKYLAQAGVVSYTEQEERKVKWKIDLNFLPILAVTYGLQYLDKVTISYAAVYGMREELGLVGTQYSWTNSLFYFGYLIGELPANYLLQKLPIAKFSAANILIWGALVMLCATAKNFAGLAVLRFLMGLFEACVSPAWVQLTGMFYRAEEQGARSAIWYSFVGVAAIVGALLSYGVGHIHIAVAEWKFIFLITGGATILWSAVIWLFLPDSPTNAKFLDERERAIAVERLRANRTGVKNEVFKWSQAKEALTDPQVIIIALWAGISNISNIAGSFLPLIIEGMGFTGLTTTLLTLPVGGVEIIAMVVAAVLSSSVQNGRTVIIFLLALPTLVGCILLEVLPQSATWGRCVGVWLFLCIPASYAIMLSLISSNVAGFSKKVTTTFLVFVTWCVGNIVSPQLFLTSEAPIYGTGISAMLVSVCLCQLLTVVLGLHYYTQNMKRGRMLRETSDQDLAAVAVANEEYLDRTDKEDYLRFRYRW